MSEFIKQVETELDEMVSKIITDIQNIAFEYHADENEMELMKNYIIEQLNDVSVEGPICGDFFDPDSEAKYGEE